MNAQPFQAFLLDLLRQAQISQNTFFQELPPGEMEIIGEPDYWSAKDHVAHLMSSSTQSFSRRTAIVPGQISLLNQIKPTLISSKSQSS